MFGFSMITVSGKPFTHAAKPLSILSHFVHRGEQGLIVQWMYFLFLKNLAYHFASTANHQSV